jgi:hypothetical protein
MKSASDPLSGLHHYALDPGIAQGVRDRQPRDTGPDHHNAFDRAGDSRRDTGSPVVVAPSG